jgi:RHH-type proline utilization regulon transcriptional repressor/proline dehydrogenase/delta 1-pyrroline-5-carboxylate dehydrogenase
VLHIVRYQRAELPQVIDTINATGYGLTLGVHSRIDETIDFITTRAHVGNIYVNRNIVGAVVGVQPFGGEGKSGTGPKAGGPLYIKRLQRGATPLLDANKHANKPYAALAALQVWARNNGHEDIVALGDIYLRTQLNGTTLELPGPTGETNRLSFFPRGVVLCAASSVKGMLNQLAAAMATGNRAFVLAATRFALPEDLPPPVKDRIRFIGAADVANCEFGIALLETGVQGNLRSQLAARTGAIVGIVDTDGAAPLALWRLVAERAVCVNTTAAGGNASLMTLGL